MNKRLAEEVSLCLRDEIRDNLTFDDTDSQILELFAEASKTEAGSKLIAYLLGEDWEPWLEQATEDAADFMSVPDLFAPLVMPDEEDEDNEEEINE